VGRGDVSPGCGFGRSVVGAGAGSAFPFGWGAGGVGVDGVDGVAGVAGVDGVGVGVGAGGVGAGGVGTGLGTKFQNRSWNTATDLAVAFFTSLSGVHRVIASHGDGEKVSQSPSPILAYEAGNRPHSCGRRESKVADFSALAPEPCPSHSV
jgi:hypothetical protein